MSIAEIAPDLTLLGAGPVIRAMGRDQLAEQLSLAYGVRGVDCGASDIQVCAQANRVMVGDVGLHYCRYDAPTRIQFSEMKGLRQFFCLAGSGSVTAGGRRLDISQASTGFIPPDVKFDAAYSERYRHLVVQFDASALRRKAELIAGRDLPNLHHLPTMEPIPAQSLSRVKAIAIALAHQFSDDTAPADVVVSELCQALASAFLSDNMRAFPALSTPLVALAGRADVRRLEDYIQANWNRPLTVEDVATACGVSVRSVFTRFKQAHGLSPMAYIRQVRLEQAKRRLQQGQGEVSVLDVALACGFSSFGHFARRYRETFGELPSATVARGRRRG